MSIENIIPSVHALVNNNMNNISSNIQNPNLKIDVIQMQEEKNIYDYSNVDKIDKFYDKYTLQEFIDCLNDVKKWSSQNCNYLSYRNSEQLLTILEPNEFIILHNSSSWLSSASISSQFDKYCVNGYGTIVLTNKAKIIYIDFHSLKIQNIHQHNLNYWIPPDYIYLLKSLTKNMYAYSEWQTSDMRDKIIQYKDLIKI